MTVKEPSVSLNAIIDYCCRRSTRCVFATRIAAVAAAMEQMIQDEAEREVALTDLADEITLRASAHPVRSTWIRSRRSRPRERR